MNAASWVCVGVAAPAALANWWSRWTLHRSTERWSKPLTLAALSGVALTIDPVDPAVRAWFVVALVLSLAGDVFLLDTERRFVAGLAAFLLAHVAYTIGFVVSDTWRWWSLLVALVPLIVLAATTGRRIVDGAATHDRALRVPVAAYLLVICSMAAAAAAAGNVWAVVGATLFVVSDTVLGWQRFVGRAHWMSLAVMVTYHLGQAGLVASLL